MKYIFFVTLFSCKVPGKRLEHSRTREKYVSCFPLQFVGAVAASRLLYNRTVQHTVKASLFVN